MDSNRKGRQISKLKYLKMGVDQKINHGSSSDHQSQSNSNHTDSFASHQSHVVNYQQTYDDTSIKVLKPVGPSTSRVQPKTFEESESRPEPSEPKFNISGLLQKLLKPRKVEGINSQKPGVKAREVKMLPGDVNFGQKNPNSFSSIFNREHQEIYGVKRVFRKSVFLLVSSAVLFALVAYTGLNLFNLSLVWTMLIWLLYVAITNIFFIIVADRSYVWVSIAAQALVFVIINAFIGTGFERITLIVTALIAILLYLAYAELEKVQLSSRIFSIAQITGESTRILSTIAVLLFAVGIFNSMISEGAESYVKRSFLDNPTIMNNVILGRYPNLSLNRVYMKGRFTIENGLVKVNVVRNGTTVKQTATFADFLAQNYRPGEVVLTEQERDEITAECQRTKKADCDAVILAERTNKLEVWRGEAYSSLPYTLTTELNTARFTEITKQFYVNEIRAFSNDSSSGSSSDLADSVSRLLIIPRGQILPAALAVVIFAALSILKFIVNGLIFLMTAIIWNILKWSGFVKIDVETVEAEIVGI